MISRIFKPARDIAKGGFLAVLLLLTLFSLPVPTQAAFPKYINFQGKITKTSDGTNVANGSYAMEFKIYDSLGSGSPPTGGTLLWTETYDQASGACAKPTLTNGVFDVKLGTCNALTIDTTTGALYLSVNFAPSGTSYDGEMAPRKQLVASAFAFNADNVVGDGRIDVAYAPSTTTNPAARINYSPGLSSSNNALSVTAGSNATGDAIIISNSGTGKDISGTSNSWNISKTGAATFITGTAIGSQTFTTNNIADSGALTIATGSNGDLALNPNGTGAIKFTLDSVGAASGINDAQFNRTGTLTANDSAADVLINRTITTSGFTDSAAALQITSNDTSTGGTDSGIVLGLTQSNAAATGAVLSFANSGSGNDITGTSNTWSVTKAGALTVASCAGCGSSPTLDSILAATGNGTARNNAAFTAEWDWNSISTQRGLTLGGGTNASITTGGVLAIGSATMDYAHTGSETGSLQTITFGDTTTSAVTSTSNGLLISPTINAASGAATRTINALSAAPTLTTCGAGTCTVNGLNVSGVTAGSNFTENGLNITGITAGAGAETGVNIGAGWDTGLALAQNASGKGLTVTATAVPGSGNDMVTITNAGQGITTANTRALQITYVGGAAAVDSAAEQIDLTPGSTVGGTWSGLKITKTSAAASGVAAYGIKLEDNNADVMNGIDRGIDISGGGWDSAITIHEGQFSTPYGGRGLVQNLVTFSEDFNNAAWVKTANTTISTNNSTQAPNGEISADTIQFAANASTDDISQTSGVAAVSNTFSASVWLRAVSGTATVRLGIRGTGGTPETTNQSITATTNWRRYAYVKTFDASATGNAEMYIDDAANSSQVQIIAWGAQLEQLGATTDAAPGPYAQTNAARINSASRAIGISLGGTVNITTPDKPTVAAGAGANGLSPLTLLGAAGGATSAASQTGGIGGAVSVTTGAGGAASGGTASTGGAGGGLTVLAGAGGASTGSGTGIGGAGGALSFTAGAGGLSSGGSTNTGGAGGAISFTTGSAGAAGNVAAGALTLDVGTSSGTGAPAISIGATASQSPAKTITIGATDATGAITLGQSTATNTISIGSATVASGNTQTINIGNGAGAGTAINVSILSGVGTAGNGTLALGNNTRVTAIGLGNIAPAAARIISIGSTGAQTPGVTDTINIGTGAGTVAGAETIHIGDGTPTGSGTNLITIGSIAALSNTTTIQGGSGGGAIALNVASGGTVGIGTNAVAKNITIGETGSTVQTINIGGGTGANVLTIGNAQTAGSLSIGAAMTSGTISIGGGAAVRTGDITIGSTGTTSGRLRLIGGTGTGAFGGSTSGIDIIPGVAGTINIGASGGAGTGTITIGQSTAAETVTIGGGAAAAGVTQAFNFGATNPASTGVVNVTIGSSNTSTGINTVTIKAGGSGASRGPAMTLGPGTTTSGICSSLTAGTGPTAGTAYQINDCASTPTADYAEMYPVASDVSYGDIVSIGTKMVNAYDVSPDNTDDWSKILGQITQLIKTNQPYQADAIGIVSNNKSNFSSTGYNIKAEDNPMPVALNGRVPVKIAPDSDPIQPGDYLTTSTTPGMATKATQAGFVIGKALDSWDNKSGKTQIIVFVEQGYFNGQSTSDFPGITTSTDTAQQVLAKLLAATPSTTTTVSELDTPRLVAGLEIVTPSITAKGLVIDNITALNDAVNFKSDTIFFGRPYFNTDTAGFAKIDQGQQSVDVVFDKPYQEQPIVNASITVDSNPNLNTADQAQQIQNLFNANIQYLIINKSLTGFTIMLKAPASQDVNFSWIALAVKGAKLFEAKDPALTPVITPPPVTSAPNAPPVVNPTTPTLTPPISNDQTTTPPDSGSVLGATTDNSAITNPPVDAPTPPAVDSTPAPAPDQPASTSTDTSATP